MSKISNIPAAPAAGEQVFRVSLSNHRPPDIYFFLARRGYRTERLASSAYYAGGEAEGYIGKTPRGSSWPS